MFGWWDIRGDRIKFSSPVFNAKLNMINLSYPKFGARPDRIKLSYLVFDAKGIGHYMG